MEPLYGGRQCILVFCESAHVCDVDTECPRLCALASSTSSLPQEHPNWQPSIQAKLMSLQLHSLCLLSPPLPSPPPSPPPSKYPHAGAVDHIWVSRVWCYDLGLPQLSETLFVNLVDGRVLDLLTRDELKRYLKITAKVHQVLRERERVDGWERRGEEGRGGEGRRGEGRRGEGRGGEGREGEGRGGEERGGKERGGEGRRGEGRRGEGRGGEGREGEGRGGEERGGKERGGEGRRGEGRRGEGRGGEGREGEGRGGEERGGKERGGEGRRGGESTPMHCIHYDQVVCLCVCAS